MNYTGIGSFNFSGWYSISLFFYNRMIIIYFYKQKKYRPFFCWYNKDQYNHWVKTHNQLKWFAGIMTGRNNMKNTAEFKRGNEELLKCIQGKEETIYKQAGSISAYLKHINRLEKEFYLKWLLKLLKKLKIITRL